MRLVWGLLTKDHGDADGARASVDREDVRQLFQHEGRALRQGHFEQLKQTLSRFFGVVVLQSHKYWVAVRAGGNEIHELGEGLGLRTRLAHQLQLAAHDGHDRLGSQECC